MGEIISSIKCKFIIVMNILPFYQILFITYLIIPIIIITRYRYSNPQIKSMLLSFAKSINFLDFALYLVCVISNLVLINPNI